MIPLTWSIAANTSGTVLAIVLAALAFLRADRHMRHARNVVQAHQRCESHCQATRLRMQPDHGRAAPPETPAERTQPQNLPLLCGDENTRLMPARGDLQAGDHR